MWYEILPSLTIITVALAIPNPAAYVIHKLFTGQPYARNIYTYNELHLFTRDIRVGNGRNTYGYRGLDNIPDEDKN